MQEGGDRDGRFLAGDALRGLACLGVMLGHSYLALAANESGRGWGHRVGASELTSMAVCVFFVLSGYLVGGPFARRFVAGEGPGPLRRYLVRRARRILPAFWVVLAVLLIAYGSRGAPGSAVVWTFLFQQNQHPSHFTSLITQGWSLDIEAAFYLALPVVFVLLARVRRGTVEQRRAALVAVIAATAVVSYLVHAASPAVNTPSCTLLAFWYALAPGMVLAVLEAPLRARLARQRRARLGGGLLAIGALLGAAVVVLQPSATSHVAFLGEIAVAVAVVGGALAGQWATGRMPRALAPRPLHVAGRWSYSMYLVHVGIGIELVDHRPAGLGKLGLFLVLSAELVALSAAAAALMWWAVEQPVLRGRRPQWPLVPRPGAGETPATLP